LAILVSDTSVLIDLDRGSLLEDVFLLPHEFAVPDLLFARELADSLGTRLVSLGLRVEELTDGEVARATVVGRQHRSLSVPDAFAFTIAEQRGWTLLSGDGRLRTVARAAMVECRGVLWLCDQLEEGHHVEVERLHAGLTAISSHARCRLPAAEIEVRLARYLS
jgi:hypothetical protein